MTHAEWTKTVLEGAAAATAITAAAYWRAAAGKPVAGYPAGMGYDVASPPPINLEIQKGAALNAKAATWASISALFQALALVVGITCR